YPRALVAGDFDGDNIQEIGLFGYTADLVTALGFVYDYSTVLDLYYLSKIWVVTTYVPVTFALTATGDLDCDGKDEIVMSDNICTIVWDDAESNYTEIFIDLNMKGRVVCGDFDGDGIKAEYTGRSWEGETFPGIMVVLAAPPTQYGIDQNYLSSITAYGAETSVGEAQGNQIGMVSSATISYGFDIDIGVSFLGFEGADMKCGDTVAKETLKTKYHTKLVEIAGSYATGSDHDSVVYHLTIYRCYEYQIISHPYNSSIIGKNITIDIPISSALHKASVPYFNELFGTRAPKIGNETFNHTIGKPWTYPSQSDIGTIAPIRWQSSEEWVGQGSGWTSIQIKVSEQQSAAMSKTTTTDHFWGGSALGLAGYESTHGKITGNIYEIITGESCTYEGVVGEINDAALHNQLEYGFGLFVYY
ncbi:MAG: hypothetical protein ACFFBD_23240, partial [Candidatus Hodarchaeota archaeon]